MNSSNSVFLLGYIWHLFKKKMSPKLAKHIVPLLLQAFVNMDHFIFPSGCCSDLMWNHLLYLWVKNFESEFV